MARLTTSTRVTAPTTTALIPGAVIIGHGGVPVRIIAKGGRIVEVDGTRSMLTRLTEAERRPKDEAFQFGWQLNRAIGSVMA